MRYFENQRVDNIGILGVRIQKLVIILTFANFLAFLQPNILVWAAAFVNQVMLLIAFYGALKRRDSMLRFYVIVNVVFFVLSVAAVVTLFVFAAPEHMGQHPVPESEHNETNPMVMMDLKPHPLALLKLHSPKGPVTSNPNQIPSSVVVHRSPFFSIVFIAVKIVVFALKITTLIFASRMANLLRTRRSMGLAHPTKAAPAPANPSRGVYQPVVYVPINAPQMPQGQAPGYQPQAFQPYYQPFMFNPYLQQQVQPPAQPSTFQYPAEV